ncbi:MAG: hypothetical protein QF704_08415, partial [Anaerolineales bacterium]|nr:hypothetical protein [Anaerolineales bacterium]
VMYLSGNVDGQLDGYMDEIRVSKGVARYTANFTVATEAFGNKTLGADSSGNDNDFTPTNLVATDQMLDSPTNNFCTMNPLAKASDSYNTLKEGNLHLEATGQGSAMSTFAMSSGQWYWECRIGTAPSWWPIVGFGKTTTAVGVGNQNYTGEQTGSWGYKPDGGQFYIDGSVDATYTSAAVGDILQFALDIPNNKAWVGINNTWVNSGDPAGGTNAIATSGLNGFDIVPIFSDSGGSGHDLVANFGQDSSFAGNETAQGNQDGNGKGDFYYEPPSGYLALCTDNLSAPEIALPTDHFNTVLYTGNGTSLAVTGVGFQPDMVTVKSRSAATSYYSYDVIRGAGERIVWDGAYAESSISGVTSFDSDGFTVGTETGNNLNTGSFVGWNWKAGGTASSNTDGTISSSVSANTTAGFSIVSYAGSGSAGDTVGHGLSQTPDLIIIKNRSGITNWVVNSPSIDSTFTKWAMKLDINQAISTDSTIWNNTAPGASVFTLGTAGESNRNNPDNYIAYCFHSVDGYSKVGKYKGNGVADGTFIYTGFRPAFIIVKNTAQVEGWCQWDSGREPYNKMSKQLMPDDPRAEYTANTTTFAIDFVSNGVKLRSSYSALNNSNQDFLYIAFAESPFKYSNAR